jgi:hypothetical protein
MINLTYAMTYWERIEGPMESTSEVPFGKRVCWQIIDAKLKGPNISAKLAFPGSDWMRVGNDDFIRRADLRVQLVEQDGSTILMSYNNAIIQTTESFLQVLKTGGETSFEDQYMRMSPIFETGGEGHKWLNQFLFIGQGRVSGKNEIEYQIYKIG